MALGGQLVRQAAAVPYRQEEGGRVDVMLICRHQSDRWGIPKGNIEQGASAAETAAAEALEEAGIEGELSQEPIGQFVYQKRANVCMVDVFAMKVTRVHPTYLEEHKRLRQWFEASAAAALVSRKAVAKMIQDLAKRLRE